MAVVILVTTIRSSSLPPLPHHCHVGGVQGRCSLPRAFYMDPICKNSLTGLCIEFTQTQFLQQPRHLNQQEILGQGNRVSCSSHITSWLWGVGWLGLRLRVLRAWKVVWKKEQPYVPAAS